MVAKSCNFVFINMLIYDINPGIERIMQKNTG